MCRQQDDFVLLVGPEHIPQLSSCLDIQARCRFVKQYKSRVTAECNCDRKFALVTARKLGSQVILLVINSNIMKHLLNLLLLVRLICSFELIEDI